MILQKYTAKEKIKLYFHLYTSLMRNLLEIHGQNKLNKLISTTSLKIKNQKALSIME